jgi:hypothetical protein
LIAGPIILLNPAPVSAAVAVAPHIDGAALGLEWGLPFVGILLSIALAPLLAPKFWHHHFWLGVLGRRFPDPVRGVFR